MTKPIGILKSVRFKLLFIALLVVFVISLVVMLSNIHETSKLMVMQQKEQAVVMTDMIEKAITVHMIESKWAELQNLVESLKDDIPELREVRIFQPGSGHIVASAEKKELGTKIYEKDWKRFQNREYDAFVVRKEDGVFASRVSPIRNKAVCYRCHGSEREFLGVIDVEVSLSRAEQMLVEIATRHFIGLMVGFGIIAIVFLIGGARLINRPLRELMGVMEGVGKGSLSMRAREGREDEFGYLAKGFNSMVASIETYQLRQMEKTAKMASLGEIMSGIAHEVKNPLTGISCAIQVLNSELKDDGRQKEIISEVLTQIKRLDRTVKDLLSYAKPKPLLFIPTRVGDLVEKVLFLVYPEAKRGNVEIVTDVPGDLPGVLVDPDQMQQVLLNLLINAVQAMPEGGLLTLSARVITSETVPGEPAAEFEGKDVLVITVKDTGKGIAPEDRDLVFEPFFTRKPKGTGLGLSISQKIVQEHGGKIGVKSEVGTGSEFLIYLPLIPDDAGEAAGHAGSPVPGRAG